MHIVQKLQNGGQPKTSDLGNGGRILPENRSGARECDRSVPRSGPRSARIRVLYIRTCVQPRSMEALCVPQLEVWGAHSGMPFPGAGPAYFQEPSIRSGIPDATPGPCFHTFMLPGAVLTLKRVATSCGAACGPPIENGFCKSAGRFPTMISGHSSRIRAQSEVSRS